MSTKRLSTSSIANNRDAKMNPVPAIVATGGSISTITDGGVSYKLHSFTSTGSSTFTITSAEPGAECEILLIGGGGGGQSGYGPGARAGGGGGGGGVVLSRFDAVPDTYSIQVATQVPDSNGSNYLADWSSGIRDTSGSMNIGAAWGGGGGYGDGGSGGGRNYEQNSNGHAIFGQGYPGSTSGYAGGGAGGAGSGNTGGPGVTLTFTGTPTIFAPGQQGGYPGNVGVSPYYGGGGYGTNPPYTAADGKQGAVFIRYKI